LEAAEVSTTSKIPFTPTGIDDDDEKKLACDATRPRRLPSTCIVTLAATEGSLTSITKQFRNLVDC
jgi:hypothetical protein